MRRGAANGNWKGGIASIKTAESILEYPKSVQSEIKRRLVSQYVVDQKTGCWQWTGNVFKVGGRAKMNLGGNITAAKVSYVVFKGPTRGLCVLHTCDNVLCVNPGHLWLGTNQDNSDDMVRKGRQAIGDKNGSRKYPERLTQRGENHINHQQPERVQAENNGRALLTNAQVREIKRQYRPYINNHKPSNQRELAEKYGVRIWVIRGIVRGTTWRSIR